MPKVIVLSLFFSLFLLLLILFPYSSCSFPCFLPIPVLSLLVPSPVFFLVLVLLFFLSPVFFLFPFLLFSSLLLFPSCSCSYSSHSFPCFLHILVLTLLVLSLFSSCSCSYSSCSFPCFLPVPALTLLVLSPMFSSCYCSFPCFLPVPVFTLLVLSPVFSCSCSCSYSLTYLKTALNKFLPGDEPVPKKFPTTFLCHGNRK